MLNLTPPSSTPVAIASRFRLWGSPVHPTSRAGGLARGLTGLVLAGLAGLSVGCSPPADVTLFASADGQALVTWGQTAISAGDLVGCSGESTDFGAAIVMTDDTLIVGAPGACTGVAAGAVVVFDKEGTRWIEGDVIERSEPSTSERFGTALAFSAPTLVVGAPLATSAGGVGAIDVFVRQGRRFQGVATLEAPFGAPARTQQSGFGEILAISGDVIVAGVPGSTVEGLQNAGAAYVYTRAGSTWQPREIVRAQASESGARFGTAVAAEAQWAAIASDGEVALFRRGELSLLRDQVLDEAGVVAMTFSNTRLALAKADQTVVIYARDAEGVWAREDTLTISGGVPTNLSWEDTTLVISHGAGVAVQIATGELTLVGDPGWTHAGLVEGAPSDPVGVAIASGQIAVGDGTTVGVFQRVSTDGETCGNGAECLSGFCVDGVCCESLCGGGAVDCFGCSVATGSSQDGVCDVAASGTVCRAATGGCDAPETCNGLSATCPTNTLRSAGTVCRAAAGPCDEVEVCSGEAPTCPVDDFANVGTLCRPTVGLCDIPETCDGLRAVCPDDATKAAGTPCRAKFGDCDIAESCDGIAPTCPTDGFIAFGTVCRNATSQCDVDERCSGLSATCPTNGFAENGSACIDGDACTENDTCQQGNCTSGERICESANPEDPEAPIFDPAPEPSPESDAGPTPGQTTCTCVASSSNRTLPMSIALLAFVGLVSVGRRRRQSPRLAGPGAAATVAVACMVLSSTNAFAQDFDGDGVPDSQDICPGDDTLDLDNDGTPDACDCAPFNQMIHPNALDICDGIDNDCDAIVDGRLVFAETGWSMVSSIASGKATGNTNYAYVLNGSIDEPMVRIQRNGFPADFSVLYQRPVDLVNVGDARIVDVLLIREPQTGDHDTQIVFSDGTRSVGMGLFDSPSHDPDFLRFDARAITGSVDGDYFIYGRTVQPPTNDSLLIESYDPSGASIYSTRYSMRIEARAGETRVMIRGPRGETSTFEVGPFILTGEEALDPNAPWDLVFPANGRSEKYQVVKLEVRQTFPDLNGEEDADVDGFPSSCDCDDENASIFPGAPEDCDGFDSDCRPSPADELDTIVRGTGATLVSRVTTGQGRNPSSRTLSNLGTKLVLGPGATNEIFYREPSAFRFPNEGTELHLSAEISNQSSGPGSFVVGVSMDQIFQGVEITTGTSPTLVTPVSYVDQTSTFTNRDARGISHAVTGKLLFSMRICGFVTADCVVEARVQSDSGATPWFPIATRPIPDVRDFPVTVVMGRVGTTGMVLDSVDVARSPVDSDSDGRCDRIDQCAGFDGDVDLDGDGYFDGCDCNDGNRDIYPGAPEQCDGIDQDCRAPGDFAAIAGGKGTELLQAITNGEAILFARTTVESAKSISFFARGTSSYLLDIPSQRRADGTTQFVIRFDADDASVTLHDGLQFIEFVRSPRRLVVNHGEMTTFGSTGTRISNIFEFDLPNEGPVDIHFSADGNAQRLGFDRPFAATFTNPLGAPIRGRTATLPTSVGPNLSGPLELRLAHTDPSDTIPATIREMTVAAVLDDGDSDFVCDIQDLCPGGDDALDGDGDGIPDGCDRCFGPDGIEDADNDGVPAGCDCNDLNPEISPLAIETCNGVDDDCRFGIDAHSAFELQGGQMRPRILLGTARSANVRAFSPRSNGTVVDVGRGFGADAVSDIYYREAMRLLPGTAGRFTVNVDRLAVAGDHDFTVGVSNGQTFFGLTLFDVVGTPGKVNATAAIANDLERNLGPITFGTPVLLDDATPFSVEFIFDSDPRFIVTASTGAVATVRPSDGGRLANFGDGLDMVLVGLQPNQSFAVRKISVRQELGDADNDGVCNAIDLCPGQDDLGTDSDADGVADACDICSLGDDAVDSDADGVPDACDLCPGSDDTLDADADGVPDGCDACPEDYANDNDGDGVCDLSDICLGGDDAQDFDADGVPDACDACPLDALNDQDEDGVCDSFDLCQGTDASGDLDGDGYCADQDCDDTRAHIYPGAEEICDGLDSNCNGALRIDELDEDGDGVIDCVAVPPVTNVPEAEPEAATDGCSCTTAASTPTGFVLGLLLFGLVSMGRRRRR